MVGRWKYGKEAAQAGIHHHLSSKTNNDPDYIALLYSRKEHSLCEKHGMRSKRKNAAFEKKRKEAHLAYARSSEGRSCSSDVMRRLNRDPEFIAKRTERLSRIGKVTGPRNITAYNKSEKHRAVAAEVGRRTIWKAIESRRRRDVDVQDVRRYMDAHPGCTLKQAAAHFNCCFSLIWQRLHPRNHKVVSVVPGPRCAVYDLSVPETENFALAAGVFVHNSKDVADAVCNCVHVLLSDKRLQVPISSGDANDILDDAVRVRGGDVPWAELDRERRR
jgi:hypothetical protein